LSSDEQAGWDLFHDKARNLFSFLSPYPKHVMLGTLRRFMASTFSLAAE
jgi:hypothetical protein